MKNSKKFKTGQTISKPPHTHLAFNQRVLNGKEVKFDEKVKPGISNLLTIHSALSGKSVSDLENEFSGKGYGDFKTAVAEVVIAKLEPIGKRTKELMDDPAELSRVLSNGAQKANEVASTTLKAAYSAIGLS